ncbi:MAG TPA: glycine oxidase ThiO [Gemmataceae bacterium]|jgi:glycine oxidase|nr:glycine oxidase ThiO [Gemmataceae bacterium]
MESPEILIVGAGVIGCSLARELARLSKQVTVVDCGRAGAAASSAAAGLLLPTLSGAVDGPLAELGFQSAAAYESWVGELRQEGAGDVGFCRQGLIEVWTDPEEAATQRRHLKSVTRPGRRVELLSREELRRLEPAVTGPVAGAGFFVDDAQVHAPALARQVARVAERAGVIIREGEAVHRLVREGDRISAVMTAAGCYHPGLVVLTAGAWSGRLLEPLGVCLPTRPVKGQMLLADCRVSPVRRPLSAGLAVFVPRADGRLALGVTVEEVGFDDRVTLEGVRSILEQTCRLVPSVGGLPLVRAWAGLRPATADGLPYMGPVEPVRNLWISTGHFRKGILLAPVCARLVARSIAQGQLVDELLPFAPSRATTAAH